MNPHPHRRLKRYRAIFLKIRHCRRSLPFSTTVFPVAITVDSSFFTKKIIRIRDNGNHRSILINLCQILIYKISFCHRLTRITLFIHCHCANDGCFRNCTDFRIKWPIIIIICWVIHIWNIDFRAKPVFIIIPIFHCNCLLILIGRKFCRYGIFYTAAHTTDIRLTAICRIIDFASLWCMQR